MLEARRGLQRGAALIESVKAIETLARRCFLKGSTIFSPLMDPHVTTFGNRLPAHTIRFSPYGADETWLNMDFKGPTLWESPPCHGVCLKWSDFDMLYEHTWNSCQALIKDTELMRTLNASKFELAYAETFDICAPGILEVIFYFFELTHDNKRNFRRV
ncbi:unnamed protein product [Strongylus vulgaris]|uniref:Uncharacterized protein n=1 Tax=Strongylus vulgaris TaxID=40348 RepID=A0A3P7JPX8_STRVU|nr:unnamed protein product [Strongylus vulgaris]